MRSSYDENDWDHNCMLYISHISENSKSRKTRKFIQKKHLAGPNWKLGFCKPGSERSLSYWVWQKHQLHSSRIKRSLEHKTDACPMKPVCEMNRKCVSTAERVKHLHNQLKPLLTKLQYLVIARDYPWGILDKWNISP